MEIPKPSFIRNYLYEYVLTTFAAAIVVLFLMVNDLNKYIREKLMEQVQATTETMHKTNDVLNTINLYQKKIINDDRKGN